LELLGLIRQNWEFSMGYGESEQKNLLSRFASPPGILHDGGLSGEWTKV
jgi:hypothetical protein